MLIIFRIVVGSLQVLVYSFLTVSYSIPVVSFFLSPYDSCLIIIDAASPVHIAWINYNARAFRNNELTYALCRVGTGKMKGRKQNLSYS